MKGLIALLALLVVLGVAFLLYRSPAGPPAGMTEAERAERETQVRQEITDLLNLYGDAYLREDMETFMSTYSSDARVFWPGANLPKDEIQGVVSEMFQTASPTGYDPTIVDLFVHGDAAYAIYEVAETIQMEGQEPETTFWNCFTRFAKEDGGWKFHRDVCGPRDAPPEG
jgi:ketosteroid isomerase-like protein